MSSSSSSNPIPQSRIHPVRLAAARPRQGKGVPGKENLHEEPADLTAVTIYPEHTRGRAPVMFRRLMERAEPTTWEYHALMGVLTRAAKTIRRERGDIPAKPRKRA